MKKLLTIIILGLCFINPSQADEISDFQIEGISVGDSLLNFTTEKKIKKNKIFYFKDKDYFTLSYDASNNFKTYENLQIHVKNNDDKFIVAGLEGALMLNKKYSECKKKKKEIENELKSIFSNLKFKNIGEEVQKNVRRQTSSHLYFNTSIFDGSVIIVQCTKFNKKIKDSKGWKDHLRVVINSEELNKFLYKNSPAY
jgi:hypothetical protein